MQVPSIHVRASGGVRARTHTHIWNEIKKKKEHKKSGRLFFTLFSLSASNALVPENDENRRQPVSLNFLPGPYRRA